MRVARVLYFVFLAFFAAAWALSYFAPCSVDVVRHGEVWELVSARGRLRADNAPAVRQDQRLTALRRKEAERLDRLFWDDFERGWEALYFDGDVSNPSAAFRTERARLLAEKAAIDRRTSILQRSTSPAVAPRSWHTPYWAAAIIALAPLMVTLMHRRLRNHRDAQRRGKLCVKCGYDIRASPFRCPECGTATNKPDGPRRSPLPEIK